MTSYFIEVKQCPDCICKIAVWGVASYNTIDAIFYTDGFVSGPMYDEDSSLLSCPKCNKLFWKEDMHTLDSMRDSKFFQNPELRSLPNSIPIRGHDYENALRKKLWKNQVQEKYIRINPTTIVNVL